MSDISDEPEVPDTDDPVLQTVALGAQWPTVDPFLFCAHHDDAYPAGDAALAPAVPVGDRDLGQDFSGADGWSMYHGRSVPGFPGHPHRGFETVTYVRSGCIDHSDSLGATARFGHGDIQWLTAGRGIVHAEMFPLVEQDRPNPLELFQIWLNLPAADKLVEPYFTMFWDGDAPVIRSADDAGLVTEITVIAGSLQGSRAPAPPPDSYASQPDADVAIWHVRMPAGARWTLPPASAEEIGRVLYVFEGATLDIAGTEVANDTGVAVRAELAVPLVAGSEPVEILVLQGRPIGEPVARYGPFVMTTEDEIRQAFEDYETTRFGNWPWSDEAPTHPRERGRFAIHADGRLDEPA